MTEFAGLELRIGGSAALHALSDAEATRRRVDLASSARAADLGRLAAWLDDDDGAGDRDRLVAALSLSPHLASIAERRPDWIDQLFDAGAGDRVRAIIDALGQPVPEGASEAAEMTRLREAKAEASLLIALRDLFGAAGPDTTTADLSDLAEAAIRRALRFVLADLHRRGQLDLPDPAHPETGCGLTILGMGKLGGRELNYSSDIDIILFFEPETPAIRDPMESVEMFSRLGRKLVRMIGERTRDGYVFRTDLRLRPDPSAMPLAIPIPSALIYYEGAGRDWERAAMIKARPVTGDPAVGEAFLREITPFVWRRYLDFVAIADIQAMKAKIDRHRGFEGVATAGHNVKLGQGGIREVEFFAQAQQLIAGGRLPSLRTRRTDEALARLASEGWVAPAVASELTEAYWFLRRVEHAIQMVADEQSHTLPTAPGDLLRIARLCNFGELNDFEDALRDRLERVQARFAALFSEGRAAGDDEGVLDGLLEDGADEAALKRLSELGYNRPADIGRIVHRWGSGRYRAMRSEAARDQFVAVLPSLLQAFSGGSDPDAALAAFDRFLEGLPSGLQFFALIASNPKLLELLAEIITSSPRLAETIARRPHVFDALLDPAFFRELPTRELIRERLSAFLGDARFFEERLDRLRIFAAEQRFLVGVRLLSGVLEGEVAGTAFSDLAEAVLGEVLTAVAAEFTRAHGRITSGRIAVLGLGRLGSRELTANSDIDLMLLYDHDPGAEISDGPRPLPVSTYYARLTQRLISALTSPTAEGVLYEVDFRLRPSGNKGPLATPIEAFRKYQAEAWTWERMALTRSRPIAGDAALCAEIGEAVREAIVAHCSDPLLTDDVADMRARLDVQKPPRGALDLKRIPGGLTDLEFLAQWGILTGRVPLDLVGAPTASVLAALRNAATDGETGFDDLPGIMLEMTRVMQILRLGGDKALRVTDLPGPLADRIAAALDLADSAGIEPEIVRRAADVREVFARTIPYRGEIGA
ncbi:bifunctional [glutamine synthetase] adenylyltransferase/[glutamine synthetase]-adenylyl-L-tyrosine phosphorylase [Aureimonas sp. Leaf324]|jgi:glutamate-ammonia-ligase adenylyltransferase|uniref:bifunctional [glutamine synthetase] adenylyltransferase/[glutamine synthetase]-adenylyl-L-tyrosine phosphorylase n=1 Tax=Aureimonas sp. Leaf324 TaxID=1736336 RepID=UPI0006FD79C6|nr:bifunctional [glutamine synthetase] adenylyltransferase/[glutamine synthetase]-adenylyl-L-tyrosine phosphorylase [Aureimonas sp. Leaf324]KQQ85835.1 bifunctional glutamine-synthetase adenylyltransferase/deadenyltransferase [Aureimonas sp. Leaf324]